MNISYNWLKDYIKTDISVEKIGEILTSTGLEVGEIEYVESIKGGLKGLVIGQIISCKPHPNSDHLNITETSIGESVLPIVCGAPNVAEGQKVIVATIGTTLYSGKDSFVIKESKIRGERSLGMLCSEIEIGVGNDSSGIIVLPNECVVGTKASDYYNVTNDYRIEIDITPNRIDGASHWGVARDLAAYLKQTQDITYGLPSVDSLHIPNGLNKFNISVENNNACHRYSGISISGIKIAESPEWLKRRLTTIGINPINNIVDITNYVLFETGQPLHAFDRNKISGDKIIVNTSYKGYKFTTLDGVERELDENDLMICNDKEPMCIAGVFGGMESGISDNTKNIFLESAYFNPVFVRKTARRHGLNTDASFRYERGSDPNMVIYALKRAAILVLEIAGGEISSDITDIYPAPIEDFDVSVEFNRINSLIGKKIDKEIIKNILTSLDIKIIEEDENGIKLKVPPYRVDVKREADIVEEIIRIYGFDNIEISPKVNSTLSFTEHPDNFSIKNKISDFLAAKGFNEIMNNSLTKSSYTEELKSLKKENNVEILNPLSSDLNIMRRTLLFGGLETIAHNINHKRENNKLFEFGKIYEYSDKPVSNPLEHYKEKELLSIFISGNKNVANWNTKEIPTDFFYTKSYCEAVLARLGLKPDNLNVDGYNDDIIKDGLIYSLNGTPILKLGIVSKICLKRTDIDTKVYFGEFYWDDIIKIIKSNVVKYTPIPKFPIVKRDLALLIDKSVSFYDIKKIAFKTEKKLLKEVRLFDVFEDEKKLGDNKKSYAVSFILMDEEKTMTDKVIDKIMNKFIGTFKFQLKAEIR